MPLAVVLLAALGMIEFALRGLFFILFLVICILPFCLPLSMWASVGIRAPEIQEFLRPTTFDFAQQLIGQEQIDRKRLAQLERENIEQRETILAFDMREGK